MKTIIRKSAIAATLILALAASFFKVNAQENNLVYDKISTPTIGITVYNGKGENVCIKNGKGVIVYEGKVTSEKTFYIPTNKLGNGTFYVYVGVLQLKQFRLI